MLTHTNDLFCHYSTLYLTAIKKRQKKQHIFAFNDLIISLVAYLMVI